MNFRVVPGKNFKNYILMDNIETDLDMKICESVGTVLSRSEYKPFIQSFNKTIQYSYLFRDVWFPAQFWQDVHKFLYDLYNIDFELEGEEYLYNNDITREFFDEFVSKLKLPDYISVDDEKYKYQQDCAYLALLNKIGRIEVGTSGGKTFITYLYCKYICDNLRLKDEKGEVLDNQKILIIVPSKLLAKQLQADFVDYQKLEEKKIFVESIYSGAKKIYDADIVCGTYQSLCQYEQEYFDDFKFIICDEVHRAKAYSIKEEIYNKTLKADFFFGMSGTYPKYNTLDYIHIVSMFGPLLYKKTVKELMDNGVSTPVKIHVIKINYKEDRNFSRSLIDAQIIGTNKYHAEKEYFHLNETRTNIICKLLKGYRTNALILVDTVEYCSQLKDAIEKYFMLTDIKKKVHIIHGNVNNRDEIIQSMKDTDKDFVLIGTYGTMSTGVSIRNIEQIYFVDGGKSEIRIRQSIGRGIRLHSNKEYCDVFDFYDNMPCSSFATHARERLKIYKEQGFDFKTTEINI